MEQKVTDRIHVLEELRHDLPTLEDRHDSARAAADRARARYSALLREAADRTTKKLAVFMTLRDLAENRCYVKAKHRGERCNSLE
jgi:hypothetical protein